VGTTNKSMAAMSGAWLHKKVRQPWLGGDRRLTMYLATLDCATSNPSLSNSPWIRGGRVDPGIFTPSPSQIPDLILSHHPARATARRLPPSAEPSGSSRHRQLAQAQRR